MMTREKNYKTLSEAFLDSEHAKHKIHFLQKDFACGGTDTVTTMTYDRFRKKAVGMARYFQNIGMQKGEKAVLATSDLQKYFMAFWGLILAGITVIPLIPPQNGALIEERHDRSRLRAIIDMTKPICLIAGSLAEAENLRYVIPDGPKIVNIDRIQTDDVGRADINILLKANEAVDRNQTAMILFTSDGTGKPKGVAISHKKALMGCYANIQYFEFSSKTVFLNWLPSEHAASLILFHILPVILHAEQVQMQTGLVLQDPKQWLKAMDRYHVQASFGPNFIYPMLLKQRKEIDALKLNLLSVRYIFNGGELINLESTQACVKLLSDKGFSEDAMIPTWGMTEIGNGAIYSRNFGKILYENFVSIGKPVPGLSVRIRKNGQLITDEEQEGSLEIRGDFILDGYYMETEEEHRERFTEDGWFKTGDLVIYKEGELVVTGKESEILMANGINYSIGEIENYIQNEILKTESKEPVRLKAAAVKNNRTQTDELYLFIEMLEDVPLTNTIKSGIAQQYTFSVESIVMTPEFPRTSIGKVDKQGLIMYAQMRRNYDLYC